MPIFGLALIASRAKITLASFEVEGILDGRDKWLLRTKVLRRVESVPLADMFHSLIRYVSCFLEVQVGRGTNWVVR